MYDAVQSIRHFTSERGDKLAEKPMLSSHGITCIICISCIKCISCWRRPSLVGGVTIRAVSEPLHERVFQIIPPVLGDQNSGHPALTFTIRAGLF